MSRSVERRENTVPIGGNLNLRVYDMTVDSYATGGEALVPQDLNMRRFVMLEAHAVGDNPYIAKYVRSQDVVRLYDPTAGAEVPADSAAEVVIEAVGV